MKILADLLLLLIVPLAKSIIILCDYSVGGGWVSIANQYQCHAFISSATNTTLVDGFGGVHISGKTNKDVTGIYTTSKHLECMPKNIEQHFPNLEGIWMTGTNLKAITKEDLRPFPKLKALYFKQGLLTHLESNLFESNPKLKFIDLSNNKINSIRVNIFDSIENLQEVRLTGNACLSVKAIGTQQLRNLKREINEKCQPEAASSTPSRFVENCKTSDSKLIDDIATLKALILMRFDQQMTDLKSSTTSQLNELKNMIKKLQSEVERLNSDHDSMTTFQ